MMYGHWPDWAALARVGAISVVLLAFGSFLITRLTPRYVKLPV
jgi:hypothetical protein